MPGDDQIAETQVMKPTSSLTRGLAAVRRDWRAGRFIKALREVSRLLETWPDNPHLLVLWSNLVQLQDDEPTPSLEEAQAAQERASELDEESPETWLELANFVDAINDDPATAVKHYQKAIGLSKRLLVESLLGQAKALSELGQKQEALAFLAEAYNIQNVLNGKSPVGAHVDEILEQLHELAHTE
jgi:tetratricopeptide (TPR) repeat protein